MQQRDLVPGEGTAGATYLSLRIHSKSCLIFPLKVAVTLLSDSGQGAVGASRLHANTSHPDVY